MSMGMAFRYTSSVTSKKGVIGFGHSSQPHDESRGFSVAESAASLLCLHALWWLDGRPQGLPVPAGAVRLTNPSSYRPRLVTGAVVVANHSPWRPNMAHTALGTSAAMPAACIAAFPSTLAAPIAPQRMPPGRPRRNVVQMARHAAKRRALAPTPSPSAQTRQADFAQACRDVADMERGLQVLSDVWRNLNADLAHAKARMHALRGAEYANGFGPVQGGEL